MSIYVMTGKLGQGKSLGAVGRIRDYLQKGRRVATNLDINVEKLLPASNRTASVIRLPDKPNSEHLLALGMGCDILDEEKYGLLVLDELGSWLNSRDWSDKSRKGLIDWLIHSRKFRWDVIFIVQDAEMMDKQIREALMEYLVTCKRLDKLPVPFFGMFVRILTLGAWTPRLPKMHVAIVNYSGGSTINHTNAIVVDRWVYRGHDLYAGYNTEQVFSADYASGMFSYLPPWHVYGRYLAPSGLAALLAALRLWLQGKRARPRLERPAALRPLLRLPPDERWEVARRLFQGMEVHS